MEVKTFLRIRPIYQSSNSKSLYSISADRQNFIVKDVSPGSMNSSPAMRRSSVKNTPVD